MTQQLRGTKAAVLSLLTLAVLAGRASADQPPSIPAWYDDEVVHFTVVNANVVGVNRDFVERIAIPIYTFGPPGDQPQIDVLSAIPGERKYRPWWEVHMVIVTDGRNVTTDPFTSEEEILEAEADEKVLVMESDFYFLCQVLPGKKR